MSKRISQSSLKAPSFKRSDCPLACALDIVGDKWSLLIVRDLLFGRSRYSGFLDAGEGLPSNILASRLRSLEKAGLVRKMRDQAQPTHQAYQLTESGLDLSAVIVALVHWSRINIPGTRPSQIG